jgi:hypothetical protein
MTEDIETRVYETLTLEEMYEFTIKDNVQITRYEEIEDSPGVVHFENVKVVTRKVI